VSTSILDNIPGLILECDEALTVLHGSPSVYRYLGYAPDELKGRNLSKFLHPGDIPVLRRALVRLTRKLGLETPVLIRFRHKSASWRYLEGSAKGYAGDSGPTRIVIHAYDVTKRTRTEKGLLESEELHRVAIDHSGSGMAVVRGGSVVRANQRFMELFRFEKPSDIIGRPLAVIAHPDDAQRLMERTVRRERGETASPRYEFRGLRRDGEQIIVEATATRVIYRGKPASLTLLRDITGRRRTEDKLRKSETTMRLVFSASPVGIVLLGENMTVTGINHRINSITGYRPDELIGRDTGILYRTDEERSRAEEKIRGDVAQCGMGSVDARWVRKNGDIRDVYLNAAAIDPGNLSMGMIITAVDITERKEAEKRLSESEERYRTAIEESNDAVSLLKEGRHIYVNDNFVKMFGYDSRDEILGVPVTMFVHPDDRPVVAEYNERRNRGEEAPTRYEFKGIRKDGAAIYVEASIATTTFRGDPVVLAYLRDITDRRKLEEEIRTREATLRSVLAACPVGVAFGDPDRVISLINERMASIIGYSTGELTGKNARVFYPSDEEYERMGEISQAALREGRIAATETKWVHRNGRLLDIQAFIAAADPTNPAAGKVFTCVDITERKKMDEALRKSEEKYRNIFERAVEGIFQTTPEGEFISANPALARMHGFGSSEEFLAYANGKRFRPVVNIEDLREFTKILEERGFVEGFEMQARKKDGNIIWISASARRVRDPVTGFAYHEGTVEDITPRKKVELELRESERRYKNLFEYANDAIFLVRGNRLVDCNSKSLEMFECARADLIGQSVHRFSPLVQPDGEDSRQKIARKVKAAGLGRPQSFEWRHLHADGTPFDVEVSLSILEMRNERLVLSIERDITDRKLSEKMLGSALAELETINAELKNANVELKESQKKIIQQEKMASIGQLAAGVAHEINNPMGFIISNLNSLDKYTKRIAQFIKAQDDVLGGCDLAESAATPLTEARQSLKIDYLLDDSPELIAESLEGAQRVKRIVQDLKSFSRVDEAEFGAADLNNVMESTLNIVWNELKYKATVKKDYGPLSEVRCNPGQLGQVFMNLLLNAVQAISEAGEIGIRTWEDDGLVCVAISDTGSGISEEKLHRIFEPFFTTKEVGKGTGLGLSIVYDIVKKHKGEIEVASEVGKGTVFTVKIPRQTPDR